MVQTVKGFPEVDEVGEERDVQLNALLKKSSDLRDLRAKVWSMHPLPILKPACSCFSFWSAAATILPRRILQKTLDGKESSEILCQLSQFWGA